MYAFSANTNSLKKKSPALTFSLLSTSIDIFTRMKKIAFLMTNCLLY